MHSNDYLEVLTCLWRWDKMYFSRSRPGSLVDASRGPDFEVKT
jgi:hypothetical protein